MAKDSILSDKVLGRIVRRRITGGLAGLISLPFFLIGMSLGIRGANPIWMITFLGIGVIVLVGALIFTNKYVQ